MAKNRKASLFDLSTSKPNKTQLLLLIGFTASITLFILLTIIGLNQLKETQKNTHEIINVHNVKVKLVEEMINAARERSLIMFTMLYLKDPFEREEAYLQFQGYAIDFINARTQLLKMNLTAEESELLLRQGELSGKSIPIQRSVVDLIRENKIDKAYHLLLDESVTAQNRVLNVLQKLNFAQSEANERIALTIEKQYENNSEIFIILAFLTLLLTLAIAIFVSLIVSRGEKKLFIEKELAQVTLYSIGDGVITTDKRGRIRIINPVAEELTGFDSDEAIGRDIAEIFSIRNQKTDTYIDNPIEIALQKNVIYTSPFNIELIRKNGDTLAIEHTVSPIRDLHDNILGANIVFRDVTEMRKLADTLAYQATHDPLTGLINRREFERRLKQAIYHAHNDGQQYALCFLDLDQFKIVNDTAGHAAGDEFLKQIAHQLSINLRRSDVLARLGGDEFAILLDDCDLKTADLIANKICATIKDTRFNWENNSFATGTSIGLVPINEYTSSVTETLSAADTACYEAKENGRNQVQVYWLDDKKLEMKRQEMRWIQKLEEALDKDRFTLYAQEYISLDDEYKKEGNLLFEILIRLREADDEIILPMAFLPAAERYHLMPQIDRWMIDKTFEFTQSIKHESGRKYNFSINLSGQTISEPDLHEYIIAKASQYNINKTTICFEITETAAIANMSKAVKLIKTLKSEGFLFSLDDFGSGLSSFAYLKNMPVDNLKIDGLFIKDIVDDPTDLAFVEAIHRIGQKMNIKTTAEFVENRETLEKLKEIGIDFAQGYYIAKPVALESLVDDNQITLEKRA
ncbi:MAG: EAL domain-containing protein [Gammaproteobacteria bacterium]